VFCGGGGSYRRQGVGSVSKLQTINLYAQLDPPKAKPVAVFVMVGVWLLLVVGYGIVGVVLAVSEDSLKNQVTEEKRQNRQLEQQVSQRKQQDEQIDLAPLEAELLSLRKKQQRQQLLKSLLKDSMQDETGQFSEALAALARQHVRGIAIEEFDLYRGGDFAIQGQLSSAELLPRYLQKLGEEPAFAHLTFNQVRMLTVDDVLTFAMSSRRPIAKGEPEGKQGS
jgi:MSHA biogenesis protein MshI